MKDTEKMAIVGELKIRIRKGESQNSLALRCGISAATLSQMINNNWALIAERMWRRVIVALKIDFNWQTAETNNYKMMMALLDNVRNTSISVGVSHDAGCGKSHAYKDYERLVDNVFYVECHTFWTRKTYMKKLLQSFGLPSEGNFDEMFERLTDHLEGLEKPLVIIDQMDKLNDSSLDLFMDFYNVLDGYCGFVVSGVPALKKRILRGCQRDKSGYKEFYSRIGKKFIYLDPVSLEDVAMICTVNGLNDEEQINHIYNTCDGDLRRVRKDVQVHFMKKRAA
jgi:DNA transposition AAA+ family ATPase